MPSGLRLDELYRMTAHIYSEQNAQRPAAATFAHFVEVCGILSMHARKKKREEVTMEDALCKALGWYFPLMAKFGVLSVEELIFRKYPYACPYCREAPHVDRKCKSVRGTKRTVDHDALRRKYTENNRRRPKDLGEWQQMFAAIYPRGLEDDSRSVVALFEEIGELAEAVRVFDRFPKYFVGEAADVFSYLMGLANEYSLQKERDDLEAFDFESEFMKRYPGLCVQCGYQICICPSVPESTVGRMAKELDISDFDDLFSTDFEKMRAESLTVSAKVLAHVGGYAGLVDSYPFDRGEANRKVVSFCLEVADRIADEDVASRLRSAALKACSVVTGAGSPKRPAATEEILRPIQEAVDGNENQIASVLGVPESKFSHSIGTIIINEYIAGDKTVGGSSIIQGPHSQASLIDLSPDWRDISKLIDITRLKSELGDLRREIGRSSNLEDQKKAIEDIARIEDAVRGSNGSAIKTALAAAGQFVREVAVSVGATLVLELMKKAAAS